MFIAIAFIIAKTWKQAKCLSVDEWIEKDGPYIQVYIQTMECYSASIKRGILQVLAAQIKWSKDFMLKEVTDVGRQILCDLPCQVENIIVKVIKME